MWAATREEERSRLEAKFSVTFRVIVITRCFKINNTCIKVRLRHENAYFLSSCTVYPSGSLPTFQRCVHHKGDNYGCSKLP
jgi:hypothetical protein